MNKAKVVLDAATRITKELADKGQIIEGGWRAYVIITDLERNATQAQIDRLRETYYHGAQHLFGSIMSILEPGQEATEGDMHRLTLIHQELDRWVASQRKQN